MQFVMSYSCGKDSTLALHKMVEAGHTPVALLVMFHEGQERSWFHGVDRPLLERIAAALELPLLLCPPTGEAYHLAFEEGLRRAMAMGAEACVFGDIDIEDNAAWCRARCEAAGLSACFPLWQRNRVENTREAVSLGYRCVVKCVRNGVLPQEYLGRVMDEEMIRDMDSRGIDVCGENGEYHTIVLDGPLFHRPVGYICREILDFGTISAVNIVSGED